MTGFDVFATWLRCRFSSDRAASLVEYALLLALIGVVCMLSITYLGAQASTKFSQVGSSVN